MTGVERPRFFMLKIERKLLAKSKKCDKIKELYLDIRSGLLF
jgi:hypothetical protein